MIRINLNELSLSKTATREPEDGYSIWPNLCAHQTARNIFFSNRVFNRWNELNQRADDATSIRAFKGSLDKLKLTRINCSSWTNLLNCRPL